MGRRGRACRGNVFHDVSFGGNAAMSRHVRTHCLDLPRALAPYIPYLEGNHVTARGCGPSVSSSASFWPRMISSSSSRAARAFSTSLKPTVGRALRETGAALKEASGMEFFTRHRPVMRFGVHKPFQTNDTFVAPSATVIGNVTNWDESSVWYGSVVRADSEHGITIGFSSNIQDGCVVTTLPKTVTTLQSGFPPLTHVGHYVSVGAGSVLISCRVEDLVLIGDKCTINEGALVESHVILEAGTVVPPYARIPSKQKWGGNPAKFISDLTEDELGSIQTKAEKIALQAQEHLVEFLPIGNTYVQLEELEKAAVEAKQG